MTVRFLADEDLRDGIVQGLRSREPAIDILDVKSAGLIVVSDQPGAIGDAIEWLLLAWMASQAEEWRDQIVYLPVR